ncbi:hypothetical protein BABINDRAFT_162458 [Babjeviella inositovora NRRL Y-12698]|uniref:CCA tRNA nucleotidyltransferase, mitochondrial n=1 Tax=Babjeviella inositovora NRRL Y-12698 TaxID=984486 RepID=A0A1E3QM66_9ASCO|nr:uncharacterized protein BABINDRAFT_162458 [Babjeviella inositovora NRRL Y-12698]ODQ78775.1 hypothetical protein BABINDRAFT_162458 [Babjeviella inositovora NRRL Y-12698]
MASQTLLPQISLSATEQKIRDLLVDYAAAKDAQTGSVPTVLRVSGGWVRDKVLGNESNDLDIAISNLSGEEFARGLMAYIGGNMDKYAGVVKKVTSIHTIASNPEKSKHLETCTTKLYDLDIDFVNLRSEEYTDQSRIPVIKFGTPEEDALRRDATLNALFYNLQTRQVEDYTGKGLTDLYQGVLRTPLQPFQTFLDDPLRVLRLIRFASRFNFVIESETLHAMTSPEIKVALSQKISRERIGVEVEKILQSQNAGYGLKLITYTGLFELIFSMGPFEEAVRAYNPDLTELLRESTISSSEQTSYTVELLPVFAQYIHSQNQQNSPVGKVFTSLSQERKMQKLFWLLTVAQPLQSLVLVTNPKKRGTLAVELLIKEGVKLGNKDAEPVAKIITLQPTLNKFIETFTKSHETVTRSDVGLMIRSYGEWWPLALTFNAFFEFLIHASTIVQLTPFNGACPRDPLDTSVVTDSNTQALGALAQEALTKYNALYQYIQEQQLGDAYNWKHVVDGKVLSKTLELKPGPWMKAVNDEIMKWQLDHPGEGKDECIEYIKTVIHKFV